MALKNATSTSRNTFSEIQKTLTSHKVQSINYKYNPDGSGKIIAIDFTIPIKGKDFSFRLPARVENVERVMYGRRTLTATQRDQAYRTAWANLRDWISAQMAMIDTGMVQAEEIFLPYLLNGQGQTFYEAMQEQQFLLPASRTLITEEQ
jgi:hypothetical protein